MKLDSSSTDAKTLEQDSSFVTKSANMSTCDNLSEQMSPQKNATSPTSTSAAVTATKVTADKDDKTSANIVKPSESPVPATSNRSVDSVTLPSPGTSLATSLQKKKDEQVDDSVNKSNISEERSAPVINKT